MPQRSTPFQKLVTHIQSQLPGSLSVQESALLLHRLTGQNREVDVVVSGLVGEHHVQISIECIEHRRPAIVTWVEQMYAKHQHLPTNRLVLVSLSGFSRKATELAERLGIDTFTPEEAEQYNWTLIVGRPELYFARYDFTVSQCELLIGAPDAPTYTKAGDDTELTSSDGKPMCALRDLTRKAIHSESFAGPAMSKITRDGRSRIVYEFKTEGAICARDNQGGLHLVHGFRLEVAGVRSTSPITIRSLSWKGVPAAFGSGVTALGETTITFVEPRPGEMDATVTINSVPQPVNRYRPPEE